LLSGGKLTALFIAQLAVCGLWVVGAWFYFRREPIEACEARGTALRRQLDTLSARDELRTAEVLLLRGDSLAALEHLPRARLLARQAGYTIDGDFDDVDRLLCGGEELARERVALLATRFAEPPDPRRAAPVVCAAPLPPRQAPVAAKGAAKGEAKTEAQADVAAQEEAPPNAPAVAKAEGDDEEGGGRGKRRHRRGDRKKIKAAGGKRGRHKGAEAAVGGEGDGPAMSAAKSQVIDALLRRQGEVRACVTGRAAGRADVTIRLTVTGRGKVTSKKIEASLPGGGGEPVRSCVDRVVAAIRFPSVSVPEVRVVQTWTWKSAG
jgi:hypothetical protein